MALFETVFDTAYLLFALGTGIYMLCRARRTQFRLFGAMAVVLGAGDAFHLVPRMLALWNPGRDFTAALGLGQMVTSVTMTIFYLLLYHVWRSRYRILGRTGLTAAVYLLAGARILLCLLPQNGWTERAPSYLFGLYRNLPFVLLGGVLIVLFFRWTVLRDDGGVRFLWLAVTVSFICYIPVVLFAEFWPGVGMLMIPKTLAYVWILLIGLQEMRWREQ